MKNAQEKLTLKSKCTSRMIHRHEVTDGRMTKDFKLNLNKPVFRYYACWQLIGISCLMCPQQQTCSSSVQWPDGTDGRTDEWMDARQMPGPCSTYYAGSANNSM